MMLPIWPAASRGWGLAGTRVKQSGPATRISRRSIENSVGCPGPAQSARFEKSVVPGRDGTRSGRDEQARVWDTRTVAQAPVCRIY